MSISKLADIHPDAVIGKEVSIEAFVRIDKDVIIGDGTWIGAGASIFSGARIGKNCKIYAGAVIASTPQDLKFHGEYSTAEIGDYTSIREYATISRGTASKGITRVGSHSLLMAYAHVGHDSVVGNHCVVANGVQIAGEVVIDDWVVIGGLSAVHQFCRIGAHAMVSGMTGILSDVAPYTKVFGVPAYFVGVNSIGLKRRGFENEQIRRIQEVYRVVYQGGMNVSQALEYLEMYLPESDEKQLISSFIKNSERGVIKAVGENKAVPEVNSKFRKFTK